MKITVRFVLVAFLLIAGIFAINWFIQRNQGNFKIAYVGRYQGLNDNEEAVERSRAFNLLHEEVIRRYIDQFNSQSGYHLELVTFNNYKNLDSTLSVYQKIEADQSIIGVIDNTWSTEIIAAKAFIRTSAIPIIAINAGRNNKDDYGPSTLFLTNYNRAVKDIVTMSTLGMGTDTVNLVSKTDYWLHNEYLEVLNEQEVTIANTFYYDEENPPEINKGNLQQVCSAERPIIMCTYGVTGEQLIDTVVHRFAGQRMIGHAEIMPQYERLDIGNQNQILLLAESESAVNRALYEDVNYLRTNFSTLQRFNLPFFAKRCQDSWYILQEAISNLDPRKATREKVEQQLLAFRENGVITPYNWMRFDEFGALIKEQNFIRIAENAVDNFDLQVNSKSEIIPNLNIGVEIIDVQNIDLNRDQFHADFFYWVIYDSAFNNLEEKIIFMNIDELENTSKLIKQKLIGNQVYKLYKVSANFIQKFDKRNFPFDQHELVIHLQLLDPTEEIKVSFDKENFQQQFGNLITSGWKSSRFYVTVDNTVTAHSKGDYALNDLDYNKFKNINFRLQINRAPNMGVLRIALPLFFIGLLAVVLLHLQSIEFRFIGGILAAVFLTVITFSVSLTRIIPVSTVLTKASLLFITTFITVVSSFLIGLVYNIKEMDKSTLVILRTVLLLGYFTAFFIIAMLNV